MAFTDKEVADHSITIEDHFWAYCRPPEHVRDQIWEGHRFTGQAIELFFVRPAYNRPGKQTEQPIAKMRFVRSKDIWQLYWMRADLKWHRYPPYPTAKSLSAALAIIHDDAHGCFFG